MWMIIKSEFLYNAFYYLLLVVLFPVYTILCIMDTQVLSGPFFEIDYWGGIYSIIIYAFLFATWGTRIKENRIRLNSLLPISANQNSEARFWLASSPFLFTTLYLTFIHLIIIDKWHEETGSLIGQLGIAFILFAGFLRTRDDWFSNWAFSKRFQKAFISVSLIQIAVVFIFLEMPEFKNGITEILGSSALNFTTLIFPFTGIVIMFFTINSFRNRRVFLS